MKWSNPDGGPEVSDVDAENVKKPGGPLPLVPRSGRFERERRLDVRYSPPIPMDQLQVLFGIGMGGSSVAFSTCSPT